MMNRPGKSREHHKRRIEDVSGMVGSQQDLNRLLNELEQFGLRNDVSVLMTDKTRDFYQHTWSGTARPSELRQGESRASESSYGKPDSREGGTKAPEGFATGGFAGGLLGAIIGGLTMVGSVVMPGAGLLVAGPLVGALTGGAIGGAAGGLIGALVGAGLPEERAVHYEKQLQELGNILVIAHVPASQTHEAKRLFERCGAYGIHVS